ncbi:alpha-amylase family glycosyl hydrolase [Deinococcus peraridilitoris]|uniref:Glycosidase n=1 Tax=Deinococcus peraridilitoris (strain DSM 19664 / LMG 22246 / CIP 109416 / KR-200) TaxID=937777 RepID=L0A270_DEIPD|nr:alpha-amylase family glycosyl hydrolase [Deinococcus peraridilitoris]AFZ67272.1 glycosidase [Deinococcus peraridilitoris DSM 19664]
MTGNEVTTDSLLWWQRGIVYQIYPRSFQDTDGDGVGDLPGVTARLDYLASLNIDAVWLSPIFTSPMKDFGYDVADYEDVDPLFGTLADFDELLSQAHARGLKVMLDLVPNHSSDQHPWFQEARRSRDNSKRDWYIWRDPAPGGGPPNNWLSFFGGRAWTFDPHSNQYYLHQFLPEQPELNWANPEVRAALLGAMRFWLARGVDGFRVDVIWLLGKHGDFLDEPANEEWREGHFEHGQLSHIYTQDLPETHAYIREMRAVLDEFSVPGQERMMVGEIYLPLEKLVTYYGSEVGAECHLPFNFLLLTLQEWSAGTVRDLARRYDEAVREYGGWPNWVLGNHDQHRFKSKYGAAHYRLAQTLLLTLRGTPTVYYGDEIGMQNVEVPRERQRDPSGLQQSDNPNASRDPERTPMQWDASPFAGFSSVEPWLPLAPDYERVNVSVQDADPHSDLHYFRRLTALRRATPELYGGDFLPLPEGGNDVFAFVRAHEGGRVMVLLNFSSRAVVLDLSAHASQARDGGHTGEVLLSSLERGGDVELAALSLEAHEALIVRLIPNLVSLP